jgi:hypothetical protein
LTKIAMVSAVTRTMPSPSITSSTRDADLVSRVDSQAATMAESTPSSSHGTLCTPMLSRKDWMNSPAAATVQMVENR